MLTKHRASPNSTDTSHRNSHQSINTSKTQLSNKKASQHPPTQSNNASNLHKLVQPKSTPPQNQHCNLHNCTPNSPHKTNPNSPTHEPNPLPKPTLTLPSSKSSNLNTTIGAKTFSFKKTKLTLG
ncbi:hypothetical protein M758_12G099700 [Ceratodon purpureus]|nr:hypothetical protein M758_12G099700 [Ceratodon purpureus]